MKAIIIRIINLMRCPACGYYAFNGIECFDCGYHIPQASLYRERMTEI